MVETRFTPGPWVCEPGHSTIRIKSNSGEILAQVGTSPYWSSYSQADEADAALIAAAPDLYAALEALASAPDDWTVDKVKAANAALSKARSEPLPLQRVE